MGIELKAHGGRLVHVRETGRVDEEDRMWDGEEPCSEPAGWAAFFIFVGIIGGLIWFGVYG